MIFWLYGGRYVEYANLVIVAGFFPLSVGLLLLTTKGLIGAVLKEPNITKLIQKGTLDKIAILEAIAEAWNRAEINYGVAHGLEGYPQTVGRDLDILIQEDHVKRAINIACKVLIE